MLIKKYFVFHILFSVVISIFSLTASAETKSDNLDFSQGVKLWANTCSRCHNLRDPSEFTDTQWSVIMGQMRIRAGLTKQQADVILKFLQASN